MENGGNSIVSKMQSLVLLVQNDPALPDMKPGMPAPDQDDQLRARRWSEAMRHELVKLDGLIDWDIFEREWLGLFPSQCRSHCDTTTGRWFVLPSACLCASHARPSWPAEVPVLAAFLHIQHGLAGPVLDPLVEIREEGERVVVDRDD